ncbi:MAG: DUF748 domain-containing protein, partial [Acaryochloridaceae cyanobacterium CSU_5_19]|nr:DUF748 domain-containing protein [Acaryochloridaceae cyanobacterium CSU_5_19]
ALSRLRIENGEVVLDPATSDSRTLSQLKGQLSLQDGNQRFQFKGQGSLDSGGKTQVAGEWFQSSESLRLEGKTDQLQVAPLMAFLPADLPIDLRSGVLDGEFKLRYQPQKPWKVSADLKAKTIDLRLPDQRIVVKAREVVSKFDLDYTPEKLPKIGGKARFQGADIVIPENLIFQNGRSGLHQLRQAQGSFEFIKDKQRLQFDNRMTLAKGGRLRTKGETSFDFKTIKVLLLAQNIPAPLLDGAFKLPLRVRSGQVDANLAILLRSDQSPYLRGTARMQGINTQVVGIPKSFNNTNGYLRFRGLRVSLEGVTSRYDQVPLEAKGFLDVENGYNLVARIPELDVNTALASMDLPPLPIALRGKIALPEVRVTGAIDQPFIQGQMVMAEGTTIDRVVFAGIKAEFEVDNPQVRVTRLEALPASGGQMTGTAVYDLTPAGELVADLKVEGVSGDAIAQLYDQSLAFRIGPIEAKTQVRGKPDNIRTYIAFATPEASYPTQGHLRIEQNILYLEQIIAQVAGGTARINGQINPETLKAQVNLAGIGLAQFSQDLKGQLQGAVYLSGPVANLNAKTLQAQGQLNFSQGISLLEQPLEARFRWTGDQIVLQEATAKGFWASGLIDAQVEGPQAPRITALNLQVRADDYDLRQLAALGPTEIPLQGRADLQGRVTGSLEALRVAAALQFQELAVSSLAFDPVMAGSVNYGPSGVELKLAGQRDLLQDRIDLSLDAGFKPNSFLVQRDDALAQGQRQGNQLQVEVERFPLQVFNFKPGVDLGLGPVFGVAAGSFVANLDRPSLVGEVQVDRPGIDSIQADRFTGQIRYLNGVASLNQGLLQQGESQYQLNARVIPDQDTQFSGNLAIVKGKVADLLMVAKALNLIDPPPEPNLAPRGTAADLATVSAGLPQKPLRSQIQRLAELDQLKAQAQSQAPLEEGPLAGLGQMQGDFGGKIKFSGTTDKGVTANFDLIGQGFTWDSYRVDQLLARGSFQEGRLNFSPLHVATGESVLAFQGQLGADQQAGQLQLQSIPLEPLNGFLDLPVEITGKLNGDLEIAGNFQDPQIQGQLTVSEGKLNQALLTNTKATLNYAQARLAIDSTTQVDGSPPVTLKGDLPFAPLFIEATPLSDELNLTAQAQDNGLALLNLVTDQVAWQGGKGSLDVQITRQSRHPPV